MSEKPVDLDKLASIQANLTRQSELLVERLTAVARPSTVFGEPVTHGEYTVIPASEVLVALGSGYGLGGAAVEAAQEEPEGSSQEDQEQPTGFGGGGGGGGISGSRPVAVISVGPHGVRVEPVVDTTKIALAIFTTLGSMLLMRKRMRRRAR